eukprot:2496390-Prymnesium_polylepis.2
MTYKGCHFHRVIKGCAVAATQAAAAARVELAREARDTMHTGRRDVRTRALLTLTPLRAPPRLVPRAASSRRAATLSRTTAAAASACSRERRRASRTTPRASR